MGSSSRMEMHQPAMHGMLLSQLLANVETKKRTPKTFLLLIVGGRTIISITKYIDVDVTFLLSVSLSQVRQAAILPSHVFV